MTHTPACTLIQNGGLPATVHTSTGLYQLTKNLTGPDIEIFKSDSSKFEIGGNDTKAAMNINTAGKYSRSVTISAAIIIKNNPNIQRNIPLNIIFNGSFEFICLPHFSF